MNISKIFYIIGSCFCFSLLSASTLSIADNLRIPVNTQGSSAIKMPDRGLSKEKVQRSYGQPERRSPAVGDPPISSWRYTDFSVYFESETVIHSVATHKKTTLDQD